jgi:hypothetical protein
MLEFIFLNVGDKMDCFASCDCTLRVTLAMTALSSTTPMSQSKRSLFASFSLEKEGLSYA